MARPRAPKKRSTLATSTKPALPAALARRAAALGARKQADLAARARSDIAFIQDKAREIAAAFHDIGTALNRLAEPGVAQALGHAGIAELVEAELHMSATKARDLMAIARLTRREDALRWGQEKSAALVELASATAAADSPHSLSRKRALSLGKRATIDIETASATAIQAAAKEVRAARREGARATRGVSVAAHERALAERLQEALHAAGETRARVTAVARPGGAADLRIERVGAAGLAALARAAKTADKGG